MFLVPSIRQIPGIVRRSGHYYTPTCLRNASVLDRWRFDVAQGYYEIEALRDKQDVTSLRRDSPATLEADTLAIRRMARVLLPDLDDRAMVQASDVVLTWYRTRSAETFPEPRELLALFDEAMVANLALVRTILESGKDYPVRDIEEELDARATASAAVLTGRTSPGWPAGLDPAVDFDGLPVQWKEIASRLDPGRRAKTIEQRCRDHAAAGKRDVWAFLAEVRRRLGTVPRSALDAAAVFAASRAGSVRT